MQASLSAVLERKGGGIYSTAPSANVAEAVRKMQEDGVGSLLVMDDNRLAGIITERDVLLRVVDEGIDPKTTLVSQVMTANPKTAAPETTVEDAMRQVTEDRVRHLPLMKGDEVLGLVSSGDLTRWVVDLQKGEIEELQGAVKKEGNKFKATIVLAAVFAILIAVGVVTS